MLSKFLLVGVGGSGGKTLRALRNNLELKLSQSNWKEGLPMGWQLLHIDSPVNQDGTGFPAPMLPTDNFHQVVDPGTGFVTDTVATFVSDKISVYPNCEFPFNVLLGLIGVMSLACLNVILVIPGTLITGTFFVPFAIYQKHDLNHIHSLNILVTEKCLV